MLGAGVTAWGLTTWLVAQETIPVEGLAEKGVLGILVVGLTWLLWQFLKQQRQDLLDERAAHKLEREAHSATRAATADMLKEATRAMERMARRRGA